VDQLPNGFSEFRRELPNYFPAWQRVPAILVYKNTLSMQRIGWTSELLPNPHAHNPLPLTMLEQLQAVDGSIEVWLNLRGEE
jgi:hypothetical protein